MIGLVKRAWKRLNRSKEVAWRQRVNEIFDKANKQAEMSKYFTPSENRKHLTIHDSQFDSTRRMAFNEVRGRLGYPPIPSPPLDHTPSPYPSSPHPDPLLSDCLPNYEIKKPSSLMPKSSTTPYPNPSHPKPSGVGGLTGYMQVDIMECMRCGKLAVSLHHDLPPAHGKCQSSIHTWRCKAGEFIPTRKIYGFIETVEAYELSLRAASTAMQNANKEAT